MTQLERVSRALQEAEIADGEGGKFPRLFDLLDYSGENKSRMIANGLAQAAIEATGVVELRSMVRKALEFYADRNKYAHTGPSKYYPLSDDEGTVARLALTQLAKGSE